VHVKPRVSIVIPTRDRGALLAQTIQTALWQRDVALEVVVVDDGSVDDTSDVVERVRDARVRSIRHEVSRGVSAARNRGVAEATGEWIGFCDDDDVWAPDKLLLQLGAAEASGRPWVYTGSVNVDLSNRVRGGSPPISPGRLMSLLPRWNPMPGGCSNIVVRAATLAETGGFDDALRIMADWDMWLRLADRAEPAIVSQPLVGYRVHPGNMSLDAEAFLAELRIVEQRYGPVDRARIVRHLAQQLLRRGQRREALPLFVRAALATPPRGWVTEVPQDARAVLAQLWPRVRARAGLPASRREVARNRRRAARDPNREWKAQAEAWLAALPEPGPVDGLR
jgi:glycosyltransferase involved in cell wall biosynthesis